VLSIHDWLARICCKVNIIDNSQQQAVCASIMQQDSQSVSVEQGLEESLSMDLVAVSNLPDQQLQQSSAQSR
jgi:hypothetical protein